MPVTEQRIFNPSCDQCNITDFGVEAESVYGGVGKLEAKDWIVNFNHCSASIEEVFCSQECKDKWEAKNE